MDARFKLCRSVSGEFLAENRRGNAGPSARLGPHKGLLTLRDMPLNESGLKQGEREKERER